MGSALRATDNVGKSESLERLTHCCLFTLCHRGVNYLSGHFKAFVFLWDFSISARHKEVSPPATLFQRSCDLNKHLSSPSVYYLAMHSNCNIIQYNVSKSDDGQTWNMLLTGTLHSMTGLTGSHCECDLVT